MTCILVCYFLTVLLIIPLLFSYNFGYNKISYNKFNFDDFYNYTYYLLKNTFNDIYNYNYSFILDNYTYYDDEFGFL